MRALTTRLLPLLLCAGYLVGCDRAPVVAGQFRKEEALDSAGQGGSGGQAGMAGMEAGASAAGTGGGPAAPPQCIPAPWFVEASIIDRQPNCEVSVRDLGILVRLQWLLPLPIAMGETRGFSSCDLEWYEGMRFDDPNSTIRICDEWCMYIKWSLALEQARLKECYAAAMDQP